MPDHLSQHVRARRSGKELLRIFVLRSSEHIYRPAVFNDLAAVHHGDRVTNPGRHTHA